MAATSATVLPPVAEKRPHTVKIGKHSKEDPYFWMRDDDRKDKDVIELLNKENEYTAARTAHTKEAQKKIYEEFLSHLKEDDSQVPYRWGPYYYTRRTVKGQNYAIYSRGTTLENPTTIANPEDVLDVNEIGKGKDFCRLGTFKPSPDHKLLAYSIDSTGYEKYDITVMDIASRKVLDTIKGATAGVQWGNNNTLYYTMHDSSMRPYKLFRHVIGKDSKDDECLFHEKDEKFWMNIGRSQSGRYIIMALGSSVTTEMHYIDLEDSASGNDEEKGGGGGQMRLVMPRKQDVEYSLDHHGDYFYVVTNEDAVNFKLCRVPVAKVKSSQAKPEDVRAALEEVLPHDTNYKLDSVDSFQDFLVLSGRSAGLPSIRLLYPDVDATQAAVGLEKYGAHGVHTVEWPDKVYDCCLSVNKEYAPSSIRLYYSSMTTPDSWFSFDATQQKLTLLKQKEVPNYNQDLYHCERWHAKGHDGTDIPMSVVYRKDLKKDADNPCLLYAYGSYGISIDADFDFKRLPLLDRGMVYVIAHIRGGGEMGRPWYENGKYLNKKNTFKDFVSCARHIIDQKVTSPDRLAISGGSAGGLLMGAVMNMAPDLFKTVITRVPFVDIMSTMSDASIPLTVIEWEEWGNPLEEKYFDYMMSYSPYDNVTAKDYPAMLVTTGLNDSRVAYWEPLKWVSKLRALKTDNNELLLKCEMESGHGGNSGRYKYLEDQAFLYAFLFDQLKLK